MGMQARGATSIRRFHLAAAGAALAMVLAVVGGLVWSGRRADAADHLDPPARTNVGANSDVAADIADLYFLHTPTSVVLALTFAGPQLPNAPATYDRDVLYRIHISNDGVQATDEFVVDVRFGRDAANNWGVQFLNIPGASGPLSGPVQTTLTDPSGVTAVAGLFDDPFFFDLVGFNETRATGTIAIRNDRNFFGGKNDTCFVIEFPRTAVANGSFPITAWSETRRISGP